MEQQKRVNRIGEGGSAATPYLNKGETDDKSERNGTRLLFEIHDLKRESPEEILQTDLLYWDEEPDDSLQNPHMDGNDSMSVNNFTNSNNGIDQNKVSEPMENTADGKMDASPVKETGAPKEGHARDKEPGRTASDDSVESPKGNQDEKEYWDEKPSWTSEDKTAEGEELSFAPLKPEELSGEPEEGDHQASGDAPKDDSKDFDEELILDPRHVMRGDDEEEEEEPMEEAPWNEGITDVLPSPKELMSEDEPAGEETHEEEESQSFMLPPEQMISPDDILSPEDALSDEDEGEAESGSGKKFRVKIKIKKRDEKKEPEFREMSPQELGPVPVEELEDREEEEEKEEYIPAKLPTFMEASPASIAEAEEGEIEEEPLKQLDLGPILKKKDIDSPFELLSPDEIEMEEDFVSLALEIGTIIKEKYEILKVINEKSDRNTYVVKDIRVTNKTYILKEIIPPQMPKQELRNRRDHFMDAIRIINTFKHPNLAEVYTGFSENNRQYYLTERVDGLDIVKLASMNTTNFPQQDVVKWGLALCEAIEFLHYRPKPFTLGNIQPYHIIVDLSGDLNIINYDLQRFFDVDRTLEFMPDDPTTLYSDITKLGRILYFLLTKEFYDEHAFELNWPSGISPKLKKLVETASKDGQKTYGDIKVFRKKLEDSLIEDEEEIVRKRFRFPKIHLDFTWVKNAAKAVAGQKAYMIALELIFIVFLVFLAVTKPYGTAAYTMPRGRPLAYIATMDSFVTVDAKTYEVLDEKRLNILPGGIIEFKTKVHPKDIEKREQWVEKQVVLISNKAGRQVLVIDAKDNNVLKNIQTGQNPFQLLLDRENKNLWVLHKTLPLILQVSSTNLKPKTVVRLENDPLDAVQVPGEIKKFTKEEKKFVKTKRGRVRIFTPEQNQIRGVVITHDNPNSVTAVDPSNGEIIGKLELDFLPSEMVVLKEEQEILFLEKEKSLIHRYLLTRKRFARPMNIPKIGRGPSSMINADGYGKVWISCKKTNNIILYDPRLGQFQNDTPETSKYAGGTKPGKLVYNKPAKQVWVMCEGTKNVTVFDYESGEVVGKVPLGKLPMNATFKQ